MDLLHTGTSVGLLYSSSTPPVGVEESWRGVVRRNEVGGVGVRES